MRAVFPEWPELPGGQPRVGISVLLSSGHQASPPHTKAAPFLQALEKHCRTEAGFSGIQDVYSSNPNHDNRQQSFFLAETLK